MHGEGICAKQTVCSILNDCKFYAGLFALQHKYLPKRAASDDWLTKKPLPTLTRQHDDPMLNIPAGKKRETIGF
jgi:hypothetical protein